MNPVYAAYSEILGTQSKDLSIGTRLLVFNILILIHLPHQRCQMASIFKARLGKNVFFFSVQSPGFQKLFLTSIYVLALFNLLTFFFFQHYI